MPTRKQVIPITIRFIKGFKFLWKNFISEHNSTHHGFEISVIFDCTFFKAQIEWPKIHQLDSAINTNANIFQRNITMVKSKMIENGVSLEKLSKHFVQIFI